MVGDWATMRFATQSFLVFALVVLAPLAGRAAYYWSGNTNLRWHNANWSSANILPPARPDTPAMVRIYSARTGRWRGIFATHTWIVVKPQGGQYERYDKVGWGTPLRRDAFPPDGHWYGNEPVELFGADGAEAEQLIAKIRAGISAYPYGQRHAYHAWPGPNSNTFIAAILAAVPEINIALPPTAIGKDFPLTSPWIAKTPSGTGWRLSLGGYFGLTVAWVEGIEINVLGGVVGIDIRRPGIKLPGIGRIGV
ncbi:MAG: DUF3750 domain-containing protein [Alphaproteobacteria bacterium]